MQKKKKNLFASQFGEAVPQVIIAIVFYRDWYHWLGKA